MILSRILQARMVAATLRRGGFFTVLFLIFPVFSTKIFAQNYVFDLVSKTRTADIYVSGNDFKVVKIAADALANDIFLVSDKKPGIKTETENLQNQLVI